VSAETAVILIVETQEGVERVDEIAATSGVDAVVFGLFDFGVDIALDAKEYYGRDETGRLHPRLREAGESVLAACERNGVTAGSVAWNSQAGIDLVERGFRLVVFDTDYGFVVRAAKSLRSDTEAILAGTTAEPRVAHRRRTGARGH
jgi:2-keto-3-deoxy-L-rhamnonate aldolase RhmA